MTRDIKPVSPNVCFVKGKTGDYYVKSRIDNPNGVTGYGNTRSEAGSYEF